jgi:outer membrane protein assembly factor BamB
VKPLLNCLFALSLLAAPLGAQQGAVLLFDADTLTGAVLSVSGKAPDSKLVVNTDPQFVSQGQGSLHLSSVSDPQAAGNTYLSVMITTPAVDMTSRALLLDVWSSTPAESRALYVRGYDAKGDCALSWASWSGLLQREKTILRLVPGMSRGGVSWEPAMIKAADRTAVVRWEIYTGTSGKGVKYDMYVDNLRTEPTVERPFTEVKQPRKLVPQTPLVKGGQALGSLTVPAGDEWQKVAGELVAGIKAATGATIPVKPGDQITNEELARGGCILLGNVANNRSFLHPYSHQQCFADGLYPGPGGYELRVVHDPWGSGHNLLLVGATDAAGARAAVQALLAKIKPGADLTLEPMCEVKLSDSLGTRFGGPLTATLDEAWLEQQKKTAEKGLSDGVHTGLFGQAARLGESYAQSGRSPYARAFVWLIKRAYEHYLTKPTTYGGPWGMDSDFTCYRVLPTWTVLENDPSLTDAERLEVAQILFRWTSEAVAPKAASTVGNERVRYNHQTFPALGCLFAGEYFHQYYQAHEGEVWLELADACFQMQQKSFKPHEDCNGYQWLTLGHTVRYCLSRPDFTLFENGNARRIADYAILSMNNLGCQVPYGDTGDWKCWFTELPILRSVEWFHRDGRYQWAVNKIVDFIGRQGLTEFATEGPVTEPTDLLGVRGWPLDPYYYKTFGGDKVVPEAKAFDKIAFRNGYAPQDTYLLLDGLSNGGHRHMDGNSILQWTANERVWVADADYIKSLPKYHNGVLILKDGQSALIPDFCELEHLADLPEFGGSVTTIRNYAGVDWRRHVLWLKSGMFVVADQMVAREPGDYSFRTIWQTVGEVRLREGGMDVEQKGQWARFALTPDTRLLLTNDEQQGKNWASYPHAKSGTVRVLQGVVNRRLEPGQSLTLFSVLQATGDKPGELKVARLGDNMAAVTGPGGPVVVVLPDATGKLAIPAGPIGQAAAVMVTPTHGFALGVRNFEMMDQKRDFPEGADVAVNLQVGEALLKLPAGAVAEPQQQVMRLQGAGMDANEVRGFMDMLIRAAGSAGAATPPTTAPRLPELKTRWDYRERLTSYLLTNNEGAFEAVDTGLQVAASPAPLPRNVFSTEDINTVDNLVDGVLLTTDGGVMWDDDQEVTIDLALNNDYTLEKLVLKAWFATSSSKGKRFQLGRLQALASNDGFRQDRRVLADFSDTATHGNWGAPGHAPQIYRFEKLTGSAKAVRLILTPRPGTAIYVSEVELWGNRPGLEIDLATRLQRGLPMHSFPALHTADLTGDGRAEVVAGSSNGQVYCLAADGSVRWKFDCEGAVNSVHTADFAGDGRLSVLAGAMGARLFALTAEGQKRWVFEAPYYKRAGHFRVVFPARLEGGRKQVAIGGSDNWHYFAVDAAGKELWRYESVHGSTAGTAADLDGDGKEEVIAGTEYYWWHAIKPEGSRLWGFSTKGGPQANAVAAGDLNGDGKKVALFGGADTLVQAVGLDGKALWAFNTGDEVQALQCADVNGDGKEEVLVASLSFNVYCLDGQGRMLWRQDLGNAVRCLALVKSGERLLLAAGSDDGLVTMLSAADGQLVARRQLGGAVLALAAADLDGQGRQSLLVSTAAGDLIALELPR